MSVIYNVLIKQLNKEKINEANDILKNNSYSKITVNFSLYVADVYHELVFCDIYIDKEQMVNGVRFIPMELKL